jgi:LPXTG-motif cell wall-anchored protein
MITHTSTTVDAVEIGISPYNQENIDYIYGLTGKDLVAVVEGDPAIIYYTTMDAGAETPVSDTDSVGEDKVYKNQDDDFEIQIESTDATDGEVSTTAVEDKEESTGPNTLLYAAGAGVLLAGGVILARKKQSTQK